MNSAPLCPSPVLLDAAQSPHEVTCKAAYREQRSVLVAAAARRRDGHILDAFGTQKVNDGGDVG